MLPAGSLNQAIGGGYCAGDAALILVGALVPLDLDAGRRQPVDGAVDVLHREVEHRERRRLVAPPSGRSGPCRRRRGAGSACRSPRSRPARASRRRRSGPGRCRSSRTRRTRGCLETCESSSRLFRQARSGYGPSERLPLAARRDRDGPRRDRRLPTPPPPAARRARLASRRAPRWAPGPPPSCRHLAEPGCGRTRPPAVLARPCRSPRACGWRPGPPLKASARGTSRHRGSQGGPRSGGTKR